MGHLAHELLFSLINYCVPQVIHLRAHTLKARRFRRVRGELVSRYLGRLGRAVVSGWAQHSRDTTNRRHELLLSVIKARRRRDVGGVVWAWRRWKMHVFSLVVVSLVVFSLVVFSLVVDACL